ncbi:sodium/potassium-transporting ATPase subunit beta-1-like [Teleopsis dalmanni]|uniref:sodium/potassium-transporting ATPase subunit beta-1-like n=1 Tax=Teleopsis dalmanni TaxID=139649 RepID=UPI0018CE9F31|nr:sodium/potassium-transporting ATPase subunit beta-1-like [Teleopsis dalmanni]
MAIALNNSPYSLRKRFRQEEEYEANQKTRETKLLLDLREGTVLTRTPLNWLSIIIFYIIFFICLALFWLLCYLIYSLTIEELTPRRAMEEPGFSFYPRLKDQNSPNIEFRENYHKEMLPYITEIKKFFAKFDAEEGNRYAGCEAKIGFGYNDNEPCVFLKINRAIGFKAKTYDDAADLPYFAPDSLRAQITANSAKGKSPNENKNKIWITCDAENLDMKFIPTNSYDSEKIYVDKKIQYDKETQRHSGTYKFYGKLDFDRVVALKFTNVTRNKKILVRCLLWAKNIFQDVDHNGESAIHFHIKIDSLKSQHGDGSDESGNQDESKPASSGPSAPPTSAPPAPAPPAPAPDTPPSDPKVSLSAEPK